MPLLTSPPQRHSERPPTDRRPRRKRSGGGQQGRGFEHCVQMPPRVLSPLSEREQHLLDALEALRSARRIAGYGWEDVCFRITRKGVKNGRHGLKIPDASVETRHGIVFLELSEEFSAAELDALEFVRTRYQVQVIAIDHQLLETIRRNPARLWNLIAEAESRLGHVGRCPFDASIRAARNATARKRDEIKANVSTGDPTRQRTARSPASLAQHVSASRSLGAMQPHRGFTAGLARTTGGSPQRAGEGEVQMSSTWAAVVKAGQLKLRDGN